ncbi:MAG: FtsX-like permease family protein [Bacteroidaceae bacterium]|nr:FtsX-like permease family protein [Bacteroidaceae bacterium]
MQLLFHYLTIAIRNLGRYKSQTIISIVGLAVGFVCLSLSALWLRYENTFNTDLPDSDRLYMMAMGDKGSVMGTPGEFLMKYAEIPEVEGATCVSTTWCTLPFSYLGDKMILHNEMGARVLITDSCFFSLFGLNIVQGDQHFYEHWHEGVAISSSLARRLYGTEDPTQCNLMMNYGGGVGSGMSIIAIYEDLDPHSDIYADIIDVQDDRYYAGTLVPYVTKLYPGLDVYESFCEKIDVLSEECGEYLSRMKLVPIPLKDSHRRGYDSEGSLSYDHLRAFLYISIMLVVCALVNFITLFVNRLRMRRREMALRLVHGESGLGLVTLFNMEALVVLLAAAALGMVGVWLLRDVFATYANIRTGGYIFTWSLIFMALTLALCLAVCIVAVVIVKNASVNRSIRTNPRSNHTFMSVSTGLQLTIGLTFVFCAAMMMKQFHHLRAYDWGVNYKNVACFRIDLPSYYEDGQFVNTSRQQMNDKGLIPQLRAIPGIEEVMEHGRCMASYSWEYESFKLRLHPEDEWTYVTLRRGLFDPGSPVNGLTVVEGTLPREADWLPDQFIITESVRDQLGLKSAVGQSVEYDTYDDTFTGTIIAVIRDIRFNDVHSDAKFYFAFRPLNPREKELIDSRTNYVAFTFDPGQKADVMRRIKEMMEPYPELPWSLEFATDNFSAQIHSEENLSRLLTIVTVVAMLIAVFGVYSIITLACRQRRKEIALRKIHGAKIRDILGIFIREYGLILVVSSAVAFAIGYIVMHRWLESYLQRTSFSWWLFALIFVATALLIALCVGSRVLRTARENPADVVKSE